MIQAPEIVDHEVRIRILETIASNIDARFTHLENKIDSHFKWTIGTIVAMVLSIATMFGSIMLTRYVEINHMQPQIKEINR